MKRRTLAFFAILAASCGARQTPAEREASARPAVVLLQGGRFADAARAADEALAKDDENALARSVRAIATWERSADALAAEVLPALTRFLRQRIDVARLRASLAHAEAALARVDDDLAVAEEDKAFALELCIACWTGDWNHDGEVNRRDERLLEIELDAKGDELPAGDPRRKPTFRLDVGDVSWARAMVAFQRALLDVALAYRWEDTLSFERSREGGGRVVQLADAGRMRAARDRILEGLDHSDHARAAYLAEKDDDREWVPSPRQQSHPLPLPVNDALYDTWSGVLGDVRRLVRSEEGLDVAELAMLAGERGQAAHGFVDVGRLLSSPRNLRFDEDALEHAERDPDAALRSVLGDAYAARMRPSPLPRRLARMAGELKNGDESLGRKLRYFLWLN